MDSNSTPAATTTDGGATETREAADMFSPPVNRAMRVLDRSFFRKTVPLSAATVCDIKQIAKTTRLLESSGDFLRQPRIMGVRPAPDGPDRGDAVFGRKQSHTRSPGEHKRKCLLLNEKVRHDDTSTWSPTIHELVNTKAVEMGPYNLELDYDYWNYNDIVSSILPDEDLSETPVGFTQVGHVVHLNLREQYLPYKFLLAEILKDKVQSAETVINKVDLVGTESEFRTFPYEVLTGSGDMNVTVKEQNCVFKFDFSKVYFNPRLQTEHTRLVQKFNEGEAVCDVMAGVGPFAIPAGKKRVFVWANDLNPIGRDSMAKAISSNKVERYVKPFNMDGREFIRYATDELLNSHEFVTVKAKLSPEEQKKSLESRTQSTQSTNSPAPQSSPKPLKFEFKSIKCPPTFDHFVMNLPATAIEFLDAFIGLYAGQEAFFLPEAGRKLPMIHVYCFSTHSGEEYNEHVDICNRVSEHIGFTISPEDKAGGTGNPERELEIHNVRLVSPKKQMFCVSFRLPAEVAFAERT